MAPCLLVTIPSPPSGGGSEKEKEETAVGILDMTGVETNLLRKGDLIGLGPVHAIKLLLVLH